MSNMSILHHENECTVNDESLNGKRIDFVCVTLIPSFTRAHASLSDTRFFLNGKEVKKSKKVKYEESIRVIWSEAVEGDLVPYEMPLDILWEDEQILVINKPVGISVHEGAGESGHTLVNALAAYLGPEFLNEMDDERIERGRPGIVHRLDKPTSGTLVVAKTKESLFNLKKQFKKRQSEKYYIAVVEGELLPPLGVIENYLVRDVHHRTRFTVSSHEEVGKHAVTEYEVLKQYSSCALVRIHLVTGRTHQIRVHMASRHHPVIGDTLYGKIRSTGDLLLHALSLSITHPLTSERMTFTSPMPERFKVHLRNNLR